MFFSQQKCFEKLRFQEAPRFQEVHYLEDHSNWQVVIGSPPIYFSHGVSSAIWKGSNPTRSLDENKLTMVINHVSVDPSWEPILQIPLDSHEILQHCPLFDLESHAMNHLRPS